jgi:hypothetical protein
MPDGKNGDNLVSNSERTPEEVKENTTKGGIASGEARRKKKERRRIFEDVLTGEYKDKNTGATITGEELLIQGIAVNLANPHSKNWLGTAKMVVEAMGYDASPEMRKKLNAEIKKIKAETDLIHAKIDALQPTGGEEAETIDDPLTAAMKDAEQIERGDFFDASE